MTQEFTIISENPDNLGPYATIGIDFFVQKELRLIGEDLLEHVVAEPYQKDFDEDGGPTCWAARFDMRNWAVFTARAGDTLVGGAAVVHDTPGMLMLDDDPRLAVLWDLRVAASFRGRGVGRALFMAAEEQARIWGCKELKVESQNNNVAAYHFYRSQGCELRRVVKDAYEEYPQELQFLWYKTL